MFEGNAFFDYSATVQNQSGEQNIVAGTQTSDISVLVIDIKDFSIAYILYLWILE